MGQLFRLIELGGEERILSEALIITRASFARLLLDAKSKTEAAISGGGDAPFC